MQKMYVYSGYTQRSLEAKPSRPRSPTAPLPQGAVVTKLHQRKRHAKQDKTYLHVLELKKVLPQCMYNAKQIFAQTETARVNKSILF